MPVFDVPYPTKGIHKGFAYSSQPKLTSPDELNVRSYDPNTDRLRGGSRPGHSKFHEDLINASNRIQGMISSTAQVQTATDELLWFYNTTDADTDAGAVWHDKSGTNHVFLTEGAAASFDVARLDEDGQVVWTKDLSTLDGTFNIWAPSDLSLLFVCGTSASSGKAIYALDPSDGSEIASDAVGGIFLRRIRGVPISGGYRFVCNRTGSGTQVYVIDYDTTAKTFTTTWSFNVGTAFPSIGAISGINSVHIDPADSDKIYVGGGTTGGGSVWLGKFTVSNETNDWEYTIAAGATAVRDIATDGGSYVYFCHDAYNPSTNRNITKIDDPSSGGTPSEQAVADTGGSGVNAIKYLSDLSIWITGAPSGTDSAWKYTSQAADELNLDHALDIGGAAVSGFYIDADSSDNAYVVRNGGVSVEGVAKLNQANIGERHRQVTLVIVSGGEVFTLIDDTLADPVAGVTITSGDFDLQMTEYGGKVYAVDGTNYRVIDTTVSPATDVDWTSVMTDGTLPTNTSDTARLIATYRARIALSGVEGDEHNVYFTRLGDPLDINASPTTVTAADPVVLNTGLAGQVADVVTALIPVNDDLLFIGGDKTISVLRGDPSPLSGGQVDRVTPSLGIRFGQAWAVSHDSRVFFVGSDGDIYWMQISGDQISMPRSLTGGRIDASLKNVNPSAVRYHLEWDIRNRGLHVYITPFQTILATHWFWEEPADAWHPDQLPNSFGPISTFVYDGDRPQDRTVLLGCRDGFIRRVDYRSSSDDGTAISSHVVYPPIKPAGQSNRFGVRRWMPMMGSDSDDVSYDLRAGDDPESALSASVSGTGTWTSGRNSDTRTRAAGNTISLKIYNTTDERKWSVDQIGIEGDVLGPVRA